jgi:hypothetical protein
MARHLGAEMRVEGAEGLVYRFEMLLPEPDKAEGR